MRACCDKMWCSAFHTLPVLCTCAVFSNTQLSNPNICLHTHAGADVKVIYATPSALSGKAAGDAAAQGVTKSDGTFAVGPLPSDASYSVEVSKAGHVLTLQEGGEAGGLTFSSKQLAQVCGCVEVGGGAGVAVTGGALQLCGRSWAACSKRWL